MDNTSSRDLRENEKTLIEIFTTLDMKYDRLLIIVEGMRDERVLRDLGVRTEIIRTQSGMSRAELLEKISASLGNGRELLILTDFDQEGDDLCRFIERGLEPHRAVILRSLRRRIRRVMGNWRCIEELVALFRRRDSPEPIGP